MNRELVVTCNNADNKDDFSVNHIATDNTNDDDDDDDDHYKYSKENVNNISNNIAN